MKFQQRLNRYLLGVAIGLILVFVIFGGRDWLGWLPKNQVRNRIVNSELTWSDDMRCRLLCFNFDNAGVLALVEQGDVDFSESQTKEDPKEYQFEYRNDTDTYRMRFKFEAIVGEDKPQVEIIEVLKNGNAEGCGC